MTNFNEKEREERFVHSNAEPESSIPEVQEYKQEQMVEPPLPSPDTPRPTMLTEFVLMYNQAAPAETLGAFIRRERAAGRIADTSDNYLARLAAFRREQH